MQMIGQQRIAAPKQRVWETLYDPEILKRCIPGCQSMTREADDRLRVIAEVKIGPIGARFNALVSRADLDPPHGYTMRIDGQGGTVGFVKSGAKLRFSDDPSGGTLLHYEVDAEVGGRLAQLGGPILDATAKQLSAKFFRELGSVMNGGSTAAALARPAPAAGSGASVASPAAVARPATASAAPTTAPTSRGLPVAWLLAICVAALAGYLVGHAGQSGTGSEWMGLSIGLLVIIVAAAGFEFGRRSATPSLTLDAALLARLAKLAQESER
jgi:carbon monoxide dehydrogenase subunit G